MNKVTRSNFLLIYAVTVIVSIVANYPGRINSDTAYMMWQAHNVDALTDWHSPFCTFVFGFLGPIFGYPAGALVVQSLLMMTWPSFVLASLARRATNVGGVIIVCGWAIIVCCFIALSGELIKDYLIVAFLSCLLFAIGLLNEDNDIFALGRSIYLLIAACAVAISLVRPPINIALIVVPGLVCVFWFLDDRIKARSATKWVICTIVASGLATVSLGSLFWAKHSDGYLTTVAYDIGGTSVLLKRDFVSELSNSGPGDPEKLASCFVPRSSDVLLFQSECNVFRDRLREIPGSVVSHWLEFILKHPVQYVQNRLSFAAWMLTNDDSGYKRVVSYPPYYMTGFRSFADFSKYATPRYADDLHFWTPTISYIPFGVIAGQFLSPDFGQNVLCQPILWVVILFVGFTWALFQKRSKKALKLALVSSFGLTNTGLMLIFSGTDCLRYLMPSWICALATVLLLFEGWGEEGWRKLERFFGHSERPAESNKLPVSVTVASVRELN